MQNLDFYSRLLNAQLHGHLKNWTLKFKVLYLLNHINHFKKISEYVVWISRTNSESLAQIQSMLRLLKHIFSRDCFYAHPTYTYDGALKTLNNTINKLH